MSETLPETPEEIDAALDEGLEAIKAYRRGELELRTTVVKPVADDADTDPEAAPRPVDPDRR